MILTKLSVDCDLSEAGIEEALTQTIGTETATLFVSSYNLRYAPDIARKYRIKYCLDDDLPSNAWYIKRDYFGVFSPGA